MDVRIHTWASAVLLKGRVMRSNTTLPKKNIDVENFCGHFTQFLLWFFWRSNAVLLSEML